MPWRVERVKSSLHVTISPPMAGEWESLMDEVQSKLDPKPLAIHLPSRMPEASKVDSDMLKLLWQSLRTSGIPLLPPMSEGGRSR